MTALMHERPEAMPEIRTDPEPVSSLSELDEVVWQAWKAIELPEGYRAEIIEGAIELSDESDDYRLILLQDDFLRTVVDEFRQLHRVISIALRRLGRMEGGPA